MKIQNPAQGVGHFKRNLDTGEVLQGRCVLNIRPGTAGSGLVFKNLLSPEKISDILVASILKGVQSVYDGEYEGVPIEDVEVDLVGCSHQEQATSEFVFNLAGIIAFSEAIRKAA